MKMITYLKKLVRKDVNSVYVDEDGNELEYNYGSLFADFVNEETEQPLDYHGYKLNVVEQRGGEDQGSDYWVVFSAEKDGEKKYFKLQGWYASYEGHTYEDYTDFYEVEEVEVMVKQWKEVK